MNIETLEAIERAVERETREVLSIFDGSIESLEQAILHAQAAAVIFLNQRHLYREFDIHHGLFELYAKYAST